MLQAQLDGMRTLVDQLRADLAQQRADLEHERRIAEAVRRGEVELRALLAERSRSWLERMPAAWRKGP